MLHASVAFDVPVVFKSGIHYKESSFLHIIFARDSCSLTERSRAEAQRQQQEAKNVSNFGAQEIVQEQRSTLKFGFGSKPVASKVSFLPLFPQQQPIIVHLFAPQIITHSAL